MTAWTLLDFVLLGAIVGFACFVIAIANMLTGISSDVTCMHKKMLQMEDDLSTLRDRVNEVASAHETLEREYNIKWMRTSTTLESVETLIEENVKSIKEIQFDMFNNHAVSWEKISMVEKKVDNHLAQLDNETIVMPILQNGTLHRFNAPKKVVKLNTVSMDKLPCELSQLHKLEVLTTCATQAETFTNLSVRALTMTTINPLWKCFPNLTTLTIDSSATTRNTEALIKHLTEYPCKIHTLEVDNSSPNLRAFCEERNIDLMYPMTPQRRATST